MSEPRKPPETPGKPAHRDGLTFLEIVGSTIAAAIGVQKKAHKERDFSRGKPVPFIIAGLLFTALFVLAVVAVVQLVLRSAGA